MLDDMTTNVDGNEELEEEVVVPPVIEVVSPVPNDEAVAYRDSIIADLEAEMPTAINSMVEYVNDLVRSRSSESDPAVTISEELLERAYSKGGLYPTHDKIAILDKTSELFSEAGYDVTPVPTEDAQTVPKYILKLKRQKS